MASAPDAREFRADYAAPAEFSPLGGEKYHNVLDFDRGRLLWGCFCGGLHVQAGDVDLSPAYEWIPLLHIFLGLHRIADRLERGETQEVYNFTEADACLSFRRFGHEVAVAASYREGIGATTPRAMRHGLAPASTRLAAHVERAAPEILGHPAWPEIKSTLTRQP